MSKNLEDRFCPQPFEFIEIGTEVYGGLPANACCSAWLPFKLGDFRKESVKEIWNNSNYQELRKSIHDGSFRFCDHSKCPKISEGTLPKKENVTDPNLRQAIDGELTELPFGPSVLNMAHDETCNLSCPSCRTHLKNIGSGEKYQELKKNS